VHRVVGLAIGLALLLAPAGVAAQGVPGTVESAVDADCGNQPLPPLPRPAIPDNPAIVDFFSSFRAPLPPAALWNPPGQRRVGLQAGHWLTEQAPPELSRLQQGSSGGGKQEWEVNLDIALRTRHMLESAGVAVDVLPATIPPSYRAHAFVAIHADGGAGGLHGFKIARPAFSSIPDVDDQLLDDLNRAYAIATGLPRDDEHISRRMLYYYAFNSRRYCHSVAPGVPQAIVETGFLTSVIDRQLLLGNPNVIAEGLADGILDFLARRPSL
jgi:N-acetylmuramoyl-L-alanine amidase